MSANKQINKNDKVDNKLGEINNWKSQIFN